MALLEIARAGDYSINSDVSLPWYLLNIVSVLELLIK
jgi:hypothetical protein